MNNTYNNMPKSAGKVVIDKPTTNTITIDAFDTLKNDVRPKTIEDYKYAVNRLQKLARNKPIEWLMKNPVDCLKIMKANNIKTPKYILTFIAPISKLYTMHPRFMELHIKSYNEWQVMTKYFKDIDKQRYDTSQWTEREKKTLIHWDVVQKKYCEERHKTDIHDTLRSSMRFMLLSTAIHVFCKRSDLGQVFIYFEDPNLSDRNYIAFKPEPVLVMNKYKTSDKNGKIREPLNHVYVTDLRASIMAHPRKYLFISTMTKEPYKLNKSYGMFFMRTFGHYFGKNTGVSMWRHIQIIAEVDFNNTPWSELKRQAQLRGHKVETQLAIYRKVWDKDNDPKDMRRPETERGTTVTCGNTNTTP